MKCFSSRLFNAKAVLQISSLVVLSFSVSGCDMAHNTLKYERSSNLEKQDFRDGLAPREEPIADDDFGNVPSLQPYIAKAPENVRPMPLVSISVNQTVPLRDVLFELAEQAEFDLELDPNIRGAIIYTARNRPFDQVIDRISDLAGLRYNFEDEILRVEVDSPYNETYRIDYLNYIRSNQSSISNDISVVSGDEADTGSDFTSSSTSESDFWGELEANMTQILGNAQNRSLRTRNDPRIVAEEQNPNVQSIAPTDSDGDGNVEVAPPDAVLRVESLPVDDGGGFGGNEEEAPAFSFAVNRQAGLVSVFGNKKAQDDIVQYLQLLKRSITAQVLIEAKILEVTLNDQFASGIDWQAVDILGGEGALGFGNSLAGQVVSTTGEILDIDNFTGTIGTTTVSTANALTEQNVLDANIASRPSLGTDFNNANNLVVGFLGNDIQAIVQALQGFGTTTALASPRLTVLNNQSAVLNVATNVVYFELDIDVNTDDDTGRSVEVDSEIKNVPEGVLVNVQPSIDLDNQTITMALRPTITRIVQRVDDPGVAVVANEAGITIESGIPELNVQEIDSVIQMRSGQPIVMGGLLQDRTTVTDEQVPVLGDIPMVGNLFKQSADSIQKTELVILLKATIIESDDTIHTTDKDLFRKFARDRRPFRF